MKPLNPKYRSVPYPLRVNLSLPSNEFTMQNFDT